MALAAFRNLEQRVNRAVMGRLVNATVIIGSAEVAVISDSPYATASVGDFGMAASAPAITVAAADAASVKPGDLIKIAQPGAPGTYVDWRVAELQPDGTGLIVLILERAA